VFWIDKFNYFYTIENHLQKALMTSKFLIVASLLFLTACNSPASEKETKVDIPQAQSDILSEMLNLRCETRNFQKLLEPMREELTRKDALLKQHAGNPKKLAEVEAEFSVFNARVDSIRQRGEEISNIMKHKMEEYFYAAQGNPELKKQLDAEIKQAFEQPCPE